MGILLYGCKSKSQKCRYLPKFSKTEFVYLKRDELDHITELSLFRKYWPTKAILPVKNSVSNKRQRVKEVFRIKLAFVPKKNAVYRQKSPDGVLVKNTTGQMFEDFICNYEELPFIYSLSLLRTVINGANIAR